MPRPPDAGHRAAQHRLAEATAARLAAMLATMPEDQIGFDAYNRAAAALVVGAQRRSAQLSFAYIASVAPPARPPSVERALAGVAVDRTSPVTRSPVLRLWRLIGEGLAARDALAEAQGYAGVLSSQDLAVAQRGGLGEAASTGEAQIIGWRKELGPSACPWCQSVAGERLYSSADAVPFHENDTCSVSPVFNGEGG